MNVDTLQRISQILRDDNGAEVYFNFTEISKAGLTEGFIDEWYKLLDWDILSQFQPFTSKSVRTHLERINFAYLEANHNVEPDVIRDFVDKMDWENLQRKWVMTPDLIQHFRPMLDPLIALQYQNLTETIIVEFLEDIMNDTSMTSDAAKWERLREYLKVVFTYQKVSCDLILRFLQKEAEINSGLDPDAPVTQQVILVDLPIVVKHQTLEESFMIQYCLPFRETVHEMCKTQKLTTAMMKTYFNQLNIRRLVKYQTLDNELTLKCLERFVFREPPVQTVSAADMLKHLSSGMGTVSSVDTSVDDNSVLLPETESDADKRYRVANSLVNSQVYSIELFKQIVAAFPDHENWRNILWCNLYLRTLTPFGDDAHMGFSENTITQEVMPNVNWDLIAECELDANQINALIDNSSQYITWYLFIKKHTLTEEQIIRLDATGVLTAIEWWLVLTTKRPEDKELSTTFVAEHKNRTTWWKQITDVGPFYTKCLEALNNLDNIDVDAITIGSRTNLRTFLRDYVNDADWKNILKNEELPEWFIRLFGHESFTIDLYWWKISRYQKLGMKNIRKNLENLDLHTLLGNQDLDMEFLEDKCPFFTEEQWNIVARGQKLTPEFIDAHKDQLVDTELAKNPFITISNDNNV